MSLVRINLPKEADLLISIITSESWPYHVNQAPSVEELKSRIEEGAFQSSDTETFWILDQNQSPVGFIRVFDLEDIDDGYPMFDLRLKSSARGQGFGKLATQALVKYLFEKYPQLDRIAGTTRSDNKAMRKVFESSGFVKEGHYRKDWPTHDGNKLDTVKYAILREDWVSGKVTPVAWND